MPRLPLLLLLLCVAAALAAPARAFDLRPGAVYVEAGKAEETIAGGVGLVWPLRERDTRYGRWSAYLDVGLSRWHPGAGERDVTRFGITPVMRLAQRDCSSACLFGELGIGVNAISPRYSGNGKGFSTVFNFGDHLGFGAMFGPGLAHEIAFRVRHFSNADIRKPNPGEDFVEVRYLRRF
jgi:lipid A 3-O-deacylase